MSFIEKLKERVQTVNQVLFASDELANERLETCNSCEHLFKPTGNCKKCGCFVKAKTKILNQQCPIKKW